MATVQERLTSLINAANATTGKADADMTTATQSLIEGFGGGSPVIKMGPYPQNFGTSFTNLFLGSDFSGASVEIYANSKMKSYNSCFETAKNIKRVKLQTDATPLTFTGFVYNSDVEILDLTGVTGQLNAYSKNITGLCAKLVAILGEMDFSLVTSGEISFGGNVMLQEIRFKPLSINSQTVYLRDSKNLSDDSISSVVAGLNTVSKPGVLKLHADVKNKLTPEQRSAIAAKNWTVA